MQFKNNCNKIDSPIFINSTCSVVTSLMKLFCNNCREAMDLEHDEFQLYC